MFALRVILTINTSRWELPLYRERRDPLVFALRVILTINTSRWVLPLNRERWDPLLFALRVILTINTSRWELPLNRERRDPLLFVLRVILTINKSQIKMGVASLSREAGTFLVLALKAARRFPVYRKRRRQLPTTCYLCYQHVIPPYRPSVFTIFPKKKRFVSYSR